MNELLNTLFQNLNTARACAARPQSCTAPTAHPPQSVTCAAAAGTLLQHVTMLPLPRRSGACSRYRALAHCATEAAEAAAEKEREQERAGGGGGREAATMHRTA